MSTSDSSDDESTRGEQSLRTKLYNARRPSAFEKTYGDFIPEGVLGELLTEEMIKHVLNIKKPTPEDDALVQFIRTQAQKSFAILVSARLNKIGKIMKWFKSKGLNDSDLPVTDPENAFCKRSWYRELIDHQWKFYAAKFSTTKYNHDFEESRILPFTSKKLDDDTPFAVKEIQATEDAQEVAEHWEKEVKALRTMNRLNQEHIVRFITAFRRRRQHGAEEHYLMFEWADGGNLRTLWKSMPSPTLTAPLVKDVVKQVLGLAKALDAAHNLNATGASYRHGDLKPENILVFRDGGLIGTLKVGDWGEAREHGQATEMRPSKTTAKYGTRRYEAPEVETGVTAKWLGQSTKRRSRLYDIWAMGCITLELTIWLLYGMEGLNRLDRELGYGSFYQTSVVNGKKVAQVHNAAVRWMDRMADDPRCQVGITAIGNLLELVRTALLVVKLPRRLGTTLSSIPERSRTDSFVDPHMDVARVTSQNIAPDEEAIESTPQPAIDVPSFSFTPAEPEPDRFPIQPEPEARGPSRCLATEFRKRVETINEEDEDESYWYAHTLDAQKLAGLSLSYSYPSASSSPSDYGPANGYQAQDVAVSMQNGNGRIETSTIKFERTGPFLRIESSGPRILSIVRDPEQLLPPTSEFQLGFVGLPEAGRSTHLEVIKYWLSDCDRHHGCKPLEHAATGAKLRLPTRLLDVGKMGDESVRLWATNPNDSGEWIALSHRWGLQHLSTTPETLQSHLDGIQLSALPATFRDAVIVTRALGRRYLWIDSLCVIQGPGGDFNTEAKRMEDVYSGAYCVIAASCSADHFSGFLKQRKRRSYVGLCREGKGETPFYVCESIDNFKDHVLDGELNSRGKLCAFLGDPDFPHILYNASQGEKILRYQELYREYSRLGLSQPYDRPTAIDGLQQRLLRTMRVKGGFGIFDEGVTRGLLRRSLLWRRGVDTPSLTRIHFPSYSVVSNVPSWSWMAYTGGIDYLQPEFNNFEWEDLQSPWSPKAPDNVSSTDFNVANMALHATAREYDLGAAVQGEGDLIFDTPNGSARPETVCVVLGKARGSLSTQTQRHYVLIIAAIGRRDRTVKKVYERVGTGYLPGKCISPSGFSVMVH
ncbi:hypothetical protein J4E93_002757 [Alternaria ventricosa]|uniref:uncharacterized protein n=1 Tax=Alternaria ventricosa TaxID=1187951 RepID=UPI0020C3294A|nr:uncharacterized protein J4E93_002757 [Alternaria ventricosa]KAI4650401.1 hypothetical protein J4E93_002757 [Alternaria ventricosa]